MKIFNMRPSLHGYSSSSIVAWYYERAWNTLTGAKRAIDEIFESGVCETLKQKFFPEKIIPHTEEQLVELLVETKFQLHRGC